MAFPLIGELRHRITFQIPVVQDDGYGGEEKAWQDAFSAWAKIEPISASERFEAMSVQASVTHKIYIRYRADVNAEMRIKHGDRVFEIEGVLDIGEKKRFLELLCSE